ncbi:radical SAM protein [bacterium]|nr:radical SAM protein [bacterium]
MYKLKHAVWEITLSCNIHCLHCGSNADINKRPKELSTEEALGLIEQLADLGCQRVVLSGGEPFMRKDWSVLAHRIVTLGMSCHYISNGYIVNDEILDVMEQIGTKYIGFSLDGSNAKTHDHIRGKEGVFDHLMWVFDRMKQRGFQVGVVSTLHKGNLHELEGIKKVLLDHAVDVWQIQTANVRGRMPREWAISDKDYYSVAEFIAKNRPRYKDILTITEADCTGYFSKLTPYMGMKHWNGCNAGMSVIGIESDGGIKGCLSMQDKKYIEGNIREQSLREIWENPNNFKYNRRFKLEDLQGICQTCKYGGICRGGCSEKAETYTGKLHCQPFCLYDMEKNGKV